MADLIVCCDRCEHSFDAMHPEAWVSSKRDGGELCPLCATIVFRSSEGWAVWNDCNGAFEVLWRRSDANQAIAERYSDCGARAEPIRVIREPEDHVCLRHWRETREHEQGAA